MKKQLTCVDLFSGAGGLSRGFMDAGYAVLLGVDFDDAALTTFQANHGTSEALKLDLFNHDNIEVREDVFQVEEIFSQEAVFDWDYRILALCDLSSDNSVLEIKSNNNDIFAFKEQLYYQSKGRNCYILQTEWVREGRQQTIKKLIFKISQVSFEIDTNAGTSVYLSPRKKAEMETINGLIEILNSHNFELKNYVNKSIPVRVRCLNCNAEMSFSYNRIIKEKFECCYCNPPMELISLEHNKSLHTKKENQAERYKNNIKIKSSAEIEVLEYNGSKQPVIAVCNICGYKWSTRADHLIERCYCPKCKGIKKIK